MARYTYGPLAVVSPDVIGGSNDPVLQNATGGVMYQTAQDARSNNNPVPIFDIGTGNPLDEITSGPMGQAQWEAEQEMPGGAVRFGDLIVMVSANETGPLAAQALQDRTASQVSAASAAQAAAAAQQALQQLEQAMANGGVSTGTGLNENSLSEVLNDSSGGISARGLVKVLVGVRRRLLVNGARTGAWEPRPNMPIVWHIGVGPKAPDMGLEDPWDEPVAAS